MINMVRLPTSAQSVYIELATKVEILSHGTCSPKGGICSPAATAPLFTLNALCGQLLVWAVSGKATKMDACVPERPNSNFSRPSMRYGQARRMPNSIEKKRPFLDRRDDHARRRRSANA
eukprot:3071305-Pleurochrysis_carterae.AAC.1